MNDDRTFKPEEIVSKLRAENLRLKNVIEIANHRISELEARLDRVRELPARGTQSVIMIGGYWINRADLMKALADD